MTSYLVESSVWVRYLRGASVEFADRLESLRADSLFVTAEPIAMELLAGVTPMGVRPMETLLASMPTLAIDPHADFRSAARIYRNARTSGHTIRSMIDCLIAAIAMRHDDVVLIHNDVDFERIALASPLRQERWAA